MSVTNDVILKQLFILRAQVDVLIGLVQGPEPEIVGCPHPQEKRRDTTTMGGERQYLCLACGETVKGTA